MIFGESTWNGSPNLPKLLAASLRCLEAVVGRVAAPRKQLATQLDALVMANVEHLRWAMDQSINDAFRNFGRRLDERLTEILQATQGAMEAALKLRGEHSTLVQQESPGWNRPLPAWERLWRR